MSGDQVAHKGQQGRGKPRTAAIGRNSHCHNGTDPKLSNRNNISRVAAAATKSTSTGQQITPTTFLQHNCFHHGQTPPQVTFDSILRVSDYFSRTFLHGKSRRFKGIATSTSRSPPARCSAGVRHAWAAHHVDNYVTRHIDARCASAACARVDQATRAWTDAQVGDFFVSCDPTSRRSTCDSADQLALYLSAAAMPDRVMMCRDVT